MKQRLTILLVDDLEKKREAVMSSLRSKLPDFEVLFEEADRYETARDHLRSRNFDFVILDIKIPAGEEDASEKWSRQLLRDILDGSLCYPMHVFGLTAHSDIANAEKIFFETNMFGFFVFDWNSDNWASAISAKIEYLALALHNGSAYRLSSFDYDLLILVARHKTEYEPVKSALFGKRKGVEHPLWPERSVFGQIALGPGIRVRAVIICIGETGLAPAATIATQGIQILRPRIVAMLGMCAGFETKGVKIFDVLVARESACWQEGKSVDKDGDGAFDSRAKWRKWSNDLGDHIARRIEAQDEALSNLLEEFSRSSEYLALKEKYGEKVAGAPAIKSGLVVSGSEVVSSNTVAKEVVSRHPTALGLEMEIFAIYSATELALGERSEYVAIKGVADFADKDKRDDTQVLASALSAELLKKLLYKWFSRNA
jgi:nucleoside phosphorylase